MAAPITEYVAAFRKAAIAKGAGLGGPKDWRLYDRMAEAYHALMALGADGVVAFTELLADPHVEVRLWAASALLQHGEPRARAVLEQIGSERGVSGLDARMTLEEFDAGRLTRAFPRRRGALTSACSWQSRTESAGGRVQRSARALRNVS